MSGDVQFLAVKDWRRFQHYGDRTPPWIKLWNGLIEDYSFGALPDAAKAHLVGIWLLASRIENKIPADPEWISKRINATDPIDLDALVASGWLIPWQPGSDMLARRKQGATPEESKKKKKSREDPPKAPHKGGSNGQARRDTAEPVVGGAAPDWGLPETAANA